MMDSTVYEKVADVRDHIYFIDFPDMDSVKYRFFDRHIHKSIEILVVYGGKISFKVAGKEGTLGAGQILLVNSYESHFYSYVGNASCYILTVSTDYLGDVLSDQSLILTTVLTPSKKQWAEVIKILKEGYAAFPEMNLLQKKAMMLSFFGALHGPSLYQEKSTVKKKDLAAGILEYLDHHYKEKIDLSSVAEAFGYSRNYFSRLFNTIIGTNFASYLNSFRLRKTEEALSLPENQGRPVEDVAASCGFTSMETFYRARRKSRKQS